MLHPKAPVRYSRRLVEAEHDIHVLHRRAAGALAHVVYRGEDDDSTPFNIHIRAYLAVIGAGDVGDAWVADVVPARLGVAGYAVHRDEGFALVELFADVEDVLPRRTGNNGESSRDFRGLQEIRTCLQVSLVLWFAQSSFFLNLATVRLEAR